MKNSIRIYNKGGNLKTIAFYLPQFHPIPENDKWWGKGFTEWTNVTKASPQFSGHHQPRLPADLGFYDLRLEEIRLEQARLAMQHGLYGFCYHYYWFNGKKLLDLPLRRLIENKEINFPFCLCYANENWTRRWDGQEEDILMKQEHSLENNINFIRDLIPFFKDSRYIKINNKPLLLVYRTAIIPDIANVAEIWRSEVKKAGFEDIYLCKCLTFGDFNDPAKIGFDATVEFPPHGLNIGEKSEYLQLAKNHNPYFNGKIFDYVEAANQMMSQNWPSYKLFKTVMLGWDNTARRGNNAHIFHNFNIETYEDWLQKVFKRTIERYSEDERIVFVNAWNEWAEGTYLEPDQKYGHECLKATKRVILTAEAWEELLSSSTKANLNRDTALGLLNYLENKERKELLLIKSLEKMEEEVKRLKNLENILCDKDVHIKNLETTIKSMKETRGWRLLEKYRGIRSRLFSTVNRDKT